MRTALTIAGSDPSGGAGIQADIKTFHAHGIFGMSVITAVTVQNTRKVYNVQELEPEIVAGQILCLFDDIEIHAVKIGMVSSIRLIAAIADTLKKVDLPYVILDPVMISKSGYRLLKEEACEAFVKTLFPVADVITPNIHEAEAITGKKIESVADMKETAGELLLLGSKKVVVKGGHLKGKVSVDVAYDGATYREYQSDRIETKNTHGTGCTFSSAIAANMAAGNDFFQSVANAKEYITGAILHSLPIGKGHGPPNHFFNMPFNLQTEAPVNP
jgi:hydroxymethylpyrimidine/phosphomethylpyrimidine kinase